MSKIEVAALSVMLQQEQDCCAPGDYQDIEVEIVDGGGGQYIVIKTQRWAIDDPEAFAALLRKWLAMVKDGKGEP